MSHIVPAMDFGTIGEPMDGAAYGFVGDISVSGRMQDGDLTPQALVLESKEIRPFRGMSGGPLLSPPLGASRSVIGIIRSGEAPPGNPFNVGLPFRAASYHALMKRLMQP